MERSVEVIRRNAFGKKDTFKSLDEANNYLLFVCEKLNNIVSFGKEKLPYELFLEEKPTFGKYEADRMELLRVDKYSTITVDPCRYSVPDR